jgi:hypothetical protein
MPKRIDIDESGDGQNEIAEALRQLNRQQRARNRESELERAVQEVGEQQKASAPPAPERQKPAGPWGTRLAWIGIAVVVIGLIVTVAVVMRPEPPPPRAATAKEAVQRFWTCLIQEKYEAATYYYPAMQSNYGSASQAAERLREVFQSNPPTFIRNIGEAEQIPDTTTFRVTYDVIKKSGQPQVGEFQVTDTGTGFVIVTGGV